MNLSFIKVIGIILMLSVSASHSFAGHPDFRKPKNWSVTQTQNQNERVDLFKVGGRQMLVMPGNSGYIRTNKKFRNFVLQVEWRWLDGAGNSGVLIHMQDPDVVWPACYQAQLKSGSAGDLICMNGLNAKELTDKVTFTVSKFVASNEKTPGEWNKMKIVSKDKTLSVYVNGVLQNKISGLSVGEGYIGFQAEGKSMQFRNLKIRTIFL